MPLGMYSNVSTQPLPDLYALSGGWKKWFLCTLPPEGIVGVRAKSGMADYTFSHDGIKAAKIETVNGVVPTDAAHLFELISSIVP